MVTVLSTELDNDARDFVIVEELGLANLSTRHTVVYEIFCLMAPLSGVLLATCMFHILLQIDVDAGCQKFMLRSLGGVSLFIPKLGCKSGGLSSG